MAAGLVMSTSVPKAFEARGLAFALAYAGIQVGRTLFMLWALRNGPEGNRRNFQRILVWFSASAVLWVAGGLAEGNARFALWAIALGIEYAGPALFFVVPGLGRSSTADWDIDGHHMAERCALFIIIALGESILVTGATFAGAEWTAPTLAGFAASFVGSLAMWWIYFDTGADRGTHFIAHSDDPGRVARGAYTYSHLPLVAGIILTAVGDELVLAHPTGHSDAKTIVAVLAGPAVYLAGNLVFKHYLGTRFALSHLVGLALLALIAPFAAPMAPMLLTSLASAVLVLVAAWEMISLRHTRAKLRG